MDIELLCANQVPNISNHGSKKLATLPDYYALHSHPREA
jgi:hypothetical protein